MARMRPSGFVAYCRPSPGAKTTPDPAESASDQHPEPGPGVFFDADVLVADMLFATLDTRTRQWELPDGRVVLLSDTVGFLQRHVGLEEASRLAASEVPVWTWRLRWRRSMASG